MRRLPLLFFLVASTATCQTVAFPASMSGDELVRKYYATDKPANKRGTYDAMYHEQAQWYINGIKESTEGTFWCYSGNEGPADLDNETLHVMRRMLIAHPKAGGASLLVKALAQRYPCKRGGTNAN